MKLQAGGQRLGRLTRRSDFQRLARRGQKWATAGLVLQAAPAPKLPDYPKEPRPRVGFTASRKVGGAVQRNRAKRRLRALALEILPLEGRAELDYVLIGRHTTPGRAYAALREDLILALDKVHRKLEHNR